MSSKRLFLSAIWLLVILPSAFAFQQDKRCIQRCGFPQPGDYSLRLPDSGETRRYFSVPADVPVSTLTLSSFVQLKCRREGDEIKIDLMLLVNGPPKPEGHPCVHRCYSMPAEGYPGQVFTTYSARLGESVTLEELARFGLEPMTVKVVSSDVQTGKPSDIDNDLKRLEVVGIEKSRGKYLVSIKNNTSMGVISLTFRYANGTSSSWAIRKPLIDAKATLDTVVGPPVNRRWNPVLFPGKNHDEDEPPRARLALAGAVFDDYSFEGDKDVALDAIPYFRARATQSQRIVSLLDTALKVTSKDHLKAFDDLKRGANALSAVPEKGVIEEMIQRYHPDERQKDQLGPRFAGVLDNFKRGFIESITCFEGHDKLSEESLASWLREMRINYDRPFRSR